MRRYVKALNGVKRVAKFWDPQSGFIGGVLCAAAFGICALGLIWVTIFMKGLFVWMN